MPCRCYIFGMSQTLDLSDLPASVADALRSVADAWRRENPPHYGATADQTAGPPRPVGWISGWDLPVSFFEPLPEGLLADFEGA